MQDKNASQQAETTVRNPFAQWLNALPKLPGMPTPEAFGEAVGDMAQKQAARFDTWLKEFAAYEAAVSERLRANAEQFSKMAEQSMTYMTELSVAYRTQAIEMMKEYMRAMTPKA